MTARVEANCPSCGTVELPADNVRLHVHRPDLGVYRFACPRCRADVVKRADRRVMELLVAAGVRGWSWARTLPDDDQPPAGLGPITLDELIDFHEQLFCRVTPRLVRIIKREAVL